MPVLKVLHRNATRLKEFGNTKETLKVVEPGKLASDKSGGEQLRDVVRTAVADAGKAMHHIVAGSPSVFNRDSSQRSSSLRWATGGAAAPGRHCSAAAYSTKNL